MRREQFPISSDQMELLLAFEAAGNLEKLAGMMAKDPSVISRNLQGLAIELPVLVKVKGRWQITPLGRQLNVLCRKNLAELAQLLKASTKNRKSSFSTPIPSDAVLVIINAQKALHDPAQGRRSNASAEENIQKVLAHWRKRKKSVIHIQHVSENPASFFFRKSPGFDFISALKPLSNELIIEKLKASAFSGTNLEKVIHGLKAKSVVLAGFSGGECIDATARQASDLGFQTFVIGDATATFDVVGPKGKLIRADKVHKNFLAHIHAMFAEVLETGAVVS